MTNEETDYSPEETKRRLRATLKAAFNMRPTPLKDIPKRGGESRKLARAKRRASASSVATSKGAPP